jgi:predicted deacylase
MEARLDHLAAASGLLVLEEYQDDLYVRFRLDKSLAGAVVNELQVPALTLEIGPRRAVDPRAVDTTVGAVLRILAAEGMVVDAPAAPSGRVGKMRRTSAPRVRRPGVFVPTLAPGALFVPGDVLGVVRGLDGEARDEVRALFRGVVVSWSEGAWLDAGAVPGTLGEEVA